LNRATWNKIRFANSVPSGIGYLKVYRRVISSIILRNAKSEMPRLVVSPLLLRAGYALPFERAPSSFRRALLLRFEETMASFTMSTALFAAPAKVSGLGFRKAINAVRVTAKPAPVQAKAVAMTVCKTKAKPGHGKAKTNKSAVKRFKITASGKVRFQRAVMLASNLNARSREARIG